MRFNITVLVSGSLFTHIKIDIYLYSYSGTNLKEDIIVNQCAQVPAAALWSVIGQNSRDVGTGQL